MTTGENYLLLQLLRALKHQQLEAMTWKALTSYTLQMCSPAGTIPESEPLRIRTALEPTLAPEYLELEQALLDDSAGPQRLLEFAMRHQ